MNSDRPLNIPVPQKIQVVQSPLKKVEFHTEFPLQHKEKDMTQTLNNLEVSTYQPLVVNVKQESEEDMSDFEFMKLVKA